MTLHQWQQLAQPNLGTILAERPGVLTKGFELLPEDSIYHLSDLEEDSEEGITFKAQHSSTPEDKKGKKLEKEKVPSKGIETPPDIFLPINSLSNDSTAGEFLCELMNTQEKHWANYSCDLYGDDHLWNNPQ